MDSCKYFDKNGPLFVVEGAFADVDHLTEVARAWNLDFYQTGTGAFRGQLTQVGNRAFHLTEAWFSHSLEQHGETPPGMRTFALPVDGNMTIRWRGKTITGNDLMVFPRNGELFSLSNAGFHVFTISLEESELVRLGEAMGYPQVADFLDSGVESVRASTSEVNALIAKCREVQSSRHAIQNPEFAPFALHHSLVETLIGVLVRRSYEHSAFRQVPNRSSALRKIREMVRDRANHPITVRELCRQTSISARTLQYAFQDEYSMTPKAWLKARALNEVRRGLRQADASRTRIADVANDWGFWHMGQFAKDYRKLFGELPSETLAQ